MFYHSPKCGFQNPMRHQETTYEWLDRNNNAQDPQVDPAQTVIT